MSNARNPIVITLFSYIFRTGIVFLLLFYIARSGQWISLLLWLMGFIITRVVLSSLLKKDYLHMDKKDSPVSEKQSKLDKE